MDLEVAKAINDISKKVNDMTRKLDRFFNDRCDKNKESIVISEQSITDMDIAQIEAEQQITDMDIRIFELEAIINE